MKAESLTEKLRVLTEFEAGRAQMAIEWVARARKPVAEIGGCLVKRCNLLALAHDLNLCIASSGEHVRAFVMPDRMPGYCFYGFYRYPWAVNALLKVWHGRPLGGQYDSLWLQGLVFGYSPDAIQRFISSALREPATNSHLARHNGRPQRPYRLCLHKVEIHGPLVRLVRRRSNRNGRYRKRD